MDVRERGWRDATSLTSLAIAALTALAVVRVGAQAVRDRTTVYMPDLWETLLGAQAAGAGRQLVGAWSRLGLYHPGPAWYFWAAPFVEQADGHPAGLALAASLLAAVALLVTFFAARSATDGLGALVVAGVLAAGIGQLSTRGLAVPWNPTIVIVPITAGLVCVAAVIVRGRTWPAVAAVLFGSLVAQAHLGTLVLGLAIVAAAVIAWRTADSKTAVSPPLWHGSVLLVAIVLPWVPVAIDQATGVGNAGAVARYAVDGTVDRRFPSEWSGRSLDLTVPEALRHVGAVTSLSQERTAVWAGADVQREHRHEPSPLSTAAAVALVAMAAAAARPQAWRRGSTDLLGSWICRVGLVALVLQVAAAMKIRHEFRIYLVAGSAGVGLALWIGVGLAVLHAARTALRNRDLPAARLLLFRRVGTAAVALGSLVAIAGFDPNIEGYRFERPGDAATVERITTALDGDAVVIQVPGRGALQPALAVTVQLERAGTPVAVRGQYRAHFSDLQRQRSTADADHDLWVVSKQTTAPPGCTDLGRFQGARICVTDRT